MKITKIATHVVNLPLKLDRVSEMRKIFDLAATWGVRVVSHSAYFGPGLLASIHVCAAQAQEVWIERF